MRRILLTLLLFPHVCLAIRNTPGGLWRQVSIVCKPGHIAGTVLQEEVFRRTGLRWPLVATLPAAGDAVVMEEGPLAAEAFAILSGDRNGRRVLRITGSPQRGLLYGAGRLLRLMEMRKGSVTMPVSVDVEAAPQKAIRGHQIGYRNLANSYDGWTPAQYDRYIREQIIFGANSIEAIPFMPASPHFTVSSREMTRRMSEICQRYDADYWVWTPATFDLNDTSKRNYFLRQFDTLFRESPRLDAVFFPGGDPGNNPPELVIPLLEELSVPLKKFHPKAMIWLSLQGFEPAQCKFVYDYIRDKKPRWLAGLVVGPGSPSPEDTRSAISAPYKLRHYPDITHTVRADFPVAWFDPAFAFTLGREPVNPQPYYYSMAYRAIEPFIDGFIGYSDGAHDDLNKMVWNQLGWNANADPRETVRQYASFFWGPDVRDAAADGILALERNWVGPIVENGGIAATLSHWQRLEAAAPALKGDWRWQMMLLRAYYDAYTRLRQIRESELETAACKALLAGPQAMREAENILSRADSCVMPAWRNRIVELCEALFRSVALQTSVKKYKASGPERGAVLDFVDRPLNNRWWLEDEFKRIRQLPPAEQRLAIDTIARWEDPGPGSFYDDVGHVGKSQHVVRGEDLNTDPLMRRSDNPGFDWWDGGMSRKRLSWMTSMRWPTAMRYDRLDTSAQYTVRISGYGESLVRANGQRLKATVYGKGIGEIKEFPVPQELTKTGSLLLTWDAIDEEHLNWRQHSRVAEVWLIKR
ncbi:hypothetical protein [Chitinophaga caseinilytica]|uniref:Beta-hexosaminidase bacterial type N-terminal domain-containing protein n=1 Tax=Chitinophaga caseinilytica TaxID=2267521 RepID=A0ABZ2YZG8_9BACT